MKTIALGSIFVLFAIITGIVSTTPSAFADHMTAEVRNAPGSSVPGCEETQECFIPHTVTIDVGGEVTWLNEDTAAHTSTSGTPADGPDGVFDSSLIMAGDSFSHTFDEAGEYPYFCMVHPWMTGMVVVQEAMGEGGEELMVKIDAKPVAKGEKMTVNVEIMDASGNAVEHVNYNIKATQMGQTILDEKEVHDHDGKMGHTTMVLPMAASDSNPVDIQVEFLGFGINEPFTGPIGHMKTTKVVPEFGPLTIIILAVAIVSIIAVSTKSKVIPKL